MPTRRVDPNGLTAALMLAFLATAGFFYVNIMAAIVSGLIDGLHFSARDAGRVGACNIYGAAAGAFFAVLLVRRVHWRRAALVLLSLLIVLDLLSTVIHSVQVLTAVRLAHGIAGGLLVGISYSVFARTASPDRCFGMLMVVQSSLGGLGLMFLPRLVPLFGAPVLFIALATFSVIALLMLPFLPAYANAALTPHRDAGTEANSLRGRSALLVALLAVFFFQAGNMAIGAYIIELGRAYGLNLEFVTTTIGVSSWIATLGAGLVVVFGTRWGRVLPVAVGAIAALIGNAAFLASASPFVYAAANVSTSITWFFVVPYLFGVCAAFDRTGRSAALAGLFSKLGYATGPYVAGLLIHGDSAASYAAVVKLALAGLALSVVFGIAAARRADVRAVEPKEVVQPAPALQ